MVTLLIGIVVFLGVHTLTTLREPRAALIARFGEGPYKGLYSLGALVGTSSARFSVRLIGVPIRGPGTR